jgi:urea transport system substrate-binding protein
VGDVVALGADGKKVGVISTINGDANIGFYKELAAAGCHGRHAAGRGLLGRRGRAVGPGYLEPRRPPGCLELLHVRRHPGERRLHRGWNAFIKDDARVTNDPMEAHYIGFNMWVNAVTEPGTTDVDAVREAMYRPEFPNLTGGMAEMLPNHHLTKPVLIGEIRADGQFDIISQTEPVPATPGPTSCRNRRCWNRLGRAAVRHVQHRDQDLRAADLQLLI